MTLASEIIAITIARGETRIFSVRVPQQGNPQYIYDDDPDNPVEVPQDIVDEATTAALAVTV